MSALVQADGISVPQTPPAGRPSEPATGRSLKKLRRLARRNDVELWSQDECHFQRHGNRCRMWVPPEGKDPVVFYAPTRQSIACFGAVSLRTGKFVRTFSPVFNAVTFEAFLKVLLRRRSRHKKMVVMLDNARYHHAKLLKPLLAAHRAHRALLFLPPYSPQFAPIERVWKLTGRLATHNLYFSSLEELLTTVESCFDPWRKPDRVLKQLCGSN